MVTSAPAVVRPSDASGVAEVLRAAGSAGPAGRTVTIRGGGTKAAWGGALSPVNVVLETTGLAGVVSHEPGDRVLTVRSGTPLRSLQESLAASGQRLCVESGYADATVGGVLATGEAGPLRLRYGSGRDLLIGVEFVRADGVLARSGGRVVKNVAGYDLGRLLASSYGTIGVITQATFRLHPLPAAVAWVVCGGVGVGVSVRKGTLLTPGVQEGVADASLRAAPVFRPDMAGVVPSALECDLPGSGDGEIAVLVEGSVAGVAARAAALRSLLRGAFADAEVVVAPEPPPWWGRYPFGDGEIGLKLAIPVSTIPAVLGALHTGLGGVASLRGSLGSGVLYVGLPSTVDVGDVTGTLAQVRSLLEGTGGSCVVVTGPPAVLESLDLWGEVPGLGLMRRLKEQFDPAGRFASGRFVGGI